MKFEELKAVCKASFFVIHAVDAEGNEHTEQISLFETVNGHYKLSKYDKADLVAFSTTTAWWGDDIIAVLEVDVRV